MIRLELATFLVALSSLALTVLMYILNFRQKNRHHEEDKNLRLLQSIVLDKEQDRSFEAIEKLDDALKMLMEPMEAQNLPVARNIIEVYFNMKLRELDTRVSIFSNINRNLYVKLKGIEEEIKNEFIPLIHDFSYTHLYPSEYKNKVTDRLMNYKGRFMKELMAVEM